MLIITDDSEVRVGDVRLFPGKIVNAEDGLWVVSFQFDGAIPVSTWCNGKAAAASRLIRRAEPEIRVGDLVHTAVQALTMPPKPTGGVVDAISEDGRLAYLRRAEGVVFMGAGPYVIEHLTRVEDRDDGRA